MLSPRPDWRRRLQEAWPEDTRLSRCRAEDPAEAGRGEEIVFNVPIKQQEPQTVFTVQARGRGPSLSYFYLGKSFKSRDL